jgi:UDP-N-acetylglucosamine 4,6-dehydratase
MKNNYFDGKEILITGGTGSLGKALIDKLLTNYNPKGIRIFSRDELKQVELKKQLSSNSKFIDREPTLPISFLIGNIKDLPRLELATEGVNIIIHAAALKHVPVCEENPLEAIQTNIIGSQNIVYAALKNKVEKVMGVSTDKSVNPINLYGATKLAAEKLFIHSNIYNGGRHPVFSCCRYGNVIGSRGSAIPLFFKQAEQGQITITDERMTRFWISLSNAAEFVLNSISVMEGKEIFIPQMRSCRMIDVANIIANTTKTPVEIKNIGIRPGEKLHEVLISEEESEFTTLCSGYFKITEKVCNSRHAPYSSADHLLDSENEIKEALKL